MALNKGTIPVEEIEGIRCRIIEASTTRERAEYLKDLLAFNGLPAIIAENPPSEDGQPVTYKLGVSDIIFNPVIAVYEKKLKTRDGRIVTPAIWNQRGDVPHLPYWVEGLQVGDIYKEELGEQ